MKKAAPKYDACWKGMPEDRKGDWPWEVMHLLRHSPIPFSVGLYLDRVRCAPASADFTEAEGRKIIQSALDWKWIIPQDEDAGLYRGFIKPKK